MLDFFKKYYQKVKDLDFTHKFYSGIAGAFIGAAGITALLVLAGVPVTGPLVLVTLGVGLLGAGIGTYLGISFTALIKDAIWGDSFNNELKSGAKDKLDNQPKIQQTYQKVNSQTSKKQPPTSRNSENFSPIPVQSITNLQVNNPNSTSLNPIISFFKGINKQFAEIKASLMHIEKPDTSINSEPPYPGL